MYIVLRQPKENLDDLEDTSLLICHMVGRQSPSKVSMDATSARATAAKLRDLYGSFFLYTVYELRELKDAKPKEPVKNLEEAITKPVVAPSVTEPEPEHPGAKTTTS